MSEINELMQTLDLTEDEAREYLSVRHLGEFRKIMYRWIVLWWLLMPFIFLGIPLFTMYRDNDMPHGGEWIVFGVMWGFFGAVWVAFGVLGPRLKRVFTAQDVDADLAAAARRAERVLKIRKAERLERAKVRHDRLVQHQRSLERERLALDVDRIRRELDADGDGQAD